MLANPNNAHIPAMFACCLDRRVMKLRCLMVALAIASPLIAQAAETDGFYVDGALGRGQLGRLSNLSDSTATTVDVGYRWSWFGIDLGYANFSRRNMTSYYQLPDNVQAATTFGAGEHGVTLDMSGRWTLGDHWYYSVRGGVYAAHTTSYADYYEPLPLHLKDSHNNVDWNAGIGFGYDFSKNFSLGLRYDWYHSDIGTTHPLSLNAEFRF